MTTKRDSPARANAAGQRVNIMGSSNSSISCEHVARAVLSEPAAGKHGSFPSFLSFTLFGLRDTGSPQLTKTKARISGEPEKGEAR